MRRLLRRLDAGVRGRVRPLAGFARQPLPHSARAVARHLAELARAGRWNEVQRTALASSDVLGDALTDRCIQVAKAAQGSQPDAADVINAGEATQAALLREARKHCLFSASAGGHEPARGERHGEEVDRALHLLECTGFAGLAREVRGAPCLLQCQGLARTSAIQAYQTWLAGAPGNAACALDDTGVLTDQSATGAWAYLRGGILIQTGHAEEARPILETVVRGACEGLPESIVTRLCACAEAVADLAQHDGVSVNCLKKAPLAGRSVPDVFVCGYGWSGSGAVYDELRQYADFGELPGPGPDAAIHADSDSEPMIYQGPYSLPVIWRHVKKRRSFCWIDWWHFFGIHVLGVWHTGHFEYKSALAGPRLMHKHPSAYVGALERLLVNLRLHLQGLQSVPLVRIFQEFFLDLHERTRDELGVSRLLLNNAVNAHHLDLFEAVGVGRAIVVHRDPRDQYADRIKEDPRYGRSPRDFANEYVRRRRKVERCIGEMEKRRYKDMRFREVSFERFVGSSAVRASVRKFAGLSTDAERTRVCFDSATSSRNVRLFSDRLSREQREHIERICGPYLKQGAAAGEHEGLA